MLDTSHVPFANKFPFIKLALLRKGSSDGIDHYLTYICVNIVFFQIEDISQQAQVRAADQFRNQAISEESQRVMKSTIDEESEEEAEVSNSDISRTICSSN